MSFNILTPATYWTTLYLWSCIFVLYLFNLKKNQQHNKAIVSLLLILAIDAFRTIIESAYFGLSASSQYGLLSPSFYQVLSQPEWVLVPKAINILAALLILTLLIRNWLPKEISDRQTITHVLSESIQQLTLTQFTLNNISEGLFWISPEGKILETNHYARETLGYSEHELHKLFVSDIDPNYTQDKWLAHWEELKQAKTLSFTSRHIKKSGQSFPVEIKTHYLQFGGKNYNCAIVRDLTDQVAVEEEMWKQANYDTLTQLPNRRLFIDRLNEAVLSARRNGTSFAVLFIDIDDFKNINDTMGQLNGDQVLMQVATRLKQAVRESDTLARLAGDEFAIIIKDVGVLRNMEVVTSKMLKRISERLFTDNTPQHLTASIGVAFYPDDALQAEALLTSAEQAMYEAKEKGQNQVRYFTEELQYRLQSRVKLANELRLALEKDELCLNYQPIVNLETNEINKLEALVRWRHPKKGYISPAEFISVAEESDLILDLGDWVLDKVLEHLPEIRRHNPAITVSINTSPKQYKHGESVQHWISKIKKSGIPGECFIFEVTENLLMPEYTSDVDALLNMIRSNGIKIAIDDFGTGYSSLSYIKRYDIDFIKIDKSFIDQLVTDNHCRAICEAIIVMAHKLNIHVIAEGIQTQEQLSILKKMGGDYGQGFLLYRPVYFENMIDLLTTKNE